MTIRQTLTGLFTSGTTTESTTTTTDDLEDEWVKAVDEIDSDSSDFVDIFDVTHAWVDHEAVTINDAWWMETGRHELSDAIEEAGLTRQEVSREIGYSESYINTTVSDSEVIPGAESLYAIEDYLLAETDVSYPIFANPVYDIKVVGATVA